MAKEENEPKFPESEVDNLIASFGREPSSKQMEKIKDIVREEKPNYRLLSRIMTPTRPRDRDKGADMER